MTDTALRWTEDARPGLPYWWDSAAPPDPVEGIPPDRADLLVIGAGYTGLSGAIAAHDAGASVVVVDAALPGQGASTRNGGMFGAHPRLGWQVLAKAYGADVADALFAEADPAKEWVKNLIKTENIDCAQQQTGRLQLAWSRADFENQRQLADTVRAKSDVEVHLIDRPGLAAEIATERYFGGLLFPQHGAIDPRRFHDGLLAAARRRGIPVVASCAVSALDRKAKGFRATTPHGPIQADQVLLATNGYTSGAFRWHQARVFPLPSFLIATEPLPPDLIDRIAPGRRMMDETRARHSYFRLSPDGTRILFGGRAAMRPIAPALAARRLRQTMLQIWPDLSDARLSHVWSGNTGYSFSHMPHVGSDRGLHWAMGFSGSGTVMAPYLGAKAALGALDDPGGQTAYRATGLRRSWLHPTAQPHFLHAADHWYRRVVDPFETRAGRSG